MSMCVCMCVPMEEHEAWRMRHSCKLPRGRAGRFKESCIEILFLFWPRLEEIVRFDSFWIMNL